VRAGYYQVMVLASMPVSEIYWTTYIVYVLYGSCCSISRCFFVLGWCLHDQQAGPGRVLWELSELSLRICQMRCVATLTADHDSSTRHLSLVVLQVVHCMCDTM